MEYLKKKFSLSYGTEKYRNNWNKVFKNFVEVLIPIPENTENVWEVVKTIDDNFLLKNKNGTTLTIAKEKCVKIK